MRWVTTFKKVIKTKQNKDRKRNENTHFTENVFKSNYRNIWEYVSKNESVLKSISILCYDFHLDCIRPEKIDRISLAKENPLNIYQVKNKIKAMIMKLQWRKCTQMGYLLYTINELNGQFYHNCEKFCLKKRNFLCISVAMIILKDQFLYILYVPPLCVLIYRIKNKSISLLY